MDGIPTVHQFDQEIEAAKANIHTAEVAERLFKNPDFIKIVGKGFLNDHALAVISHKAERGNGSDADQKFLDNQIMGVSVLMDYFTSIRVLGNSAEQTMESAEMDREEILQYEQENREEV